MSKEEIFVFLEKEMSSYSGPMSEFFDRQMVKVINRGSKPDEILHTIRFCIPYIKDELDFSDFRQIFEQFCDIQEKHYRNLYTMVQNHHEKASNKFH